MMTAVQTLERIASIQIVINIKLIHGVQLVNTQSLKSKYDTPNARMFVCTRLLN